MKELDEKKELHLYRLNGADIEELLKKDGNTEKYIKDNSIYYHYYITEVLKQYNFYGSKTNGGYMKIYTKKLKETMPYPRIGVGKRERLVYRIERDLKKWGVCNNYLSWNQNEKGNPYNTKHVIIYPSILKHGYSRIPSCLKIEKLRDKIHSWKIKNNVLDAKSAPLKSYHLQLKKIVSNFTLDKERARKALKIHVANKSELPEKRINGKITKRYFCDPEIKGAYEMIIDVFDEIETFILDGKTGRVYNRLTNLPRFLRQFLLYKNKPINLIELDIANSQPLLFSLVLNEYYKNKKLPYDVKKYILDCEKGVFYDKLIDHLFWENKSLRIPRNVFKTDVFAKVYFNKKTKKLNKYEQLFESVYPNVYMVLQRLKVIKDNEVAIRLQKAESSLVIDKCAKQMLEKGMTLFTLHDGIFVLKGKEIEADKMMKEQFQLMGLNPHLELKS